MKHLQGTRPNCKAPGAFGVGDLGIHNNGRFPVMPENPWMNPHPLYLSWEPPTRGKS
jgi:hypothetical protein